eukprot:gene31023-37496_t
MMHKVSSRRLETGLRAVISRLLCSGKGNSFKVSYECSKWVVPDMELTLLERSVNNGCRSVITRSCEHLTSVYDCIQDLQDGLDLEGEPFQVTHILAINRDTQLDRILQRYQEELTSINRRVPANIVENVGIQLPDSILQDEKLLVGTIQSLHSQIQSHKQIKHTKVGLAFDSKQLAMQAIGKDPNIVSAHPLSLSNIQRAYSTLPLNVCVLPANLHALDSAKQIAQMLQNISPNSHTDIVLTEILRIFSHKPGYVYSDYESYGAYTHVIDKSSHSIWKLYDSLISQQTQPIALSSTTHITSPNVPPIPGVNMQMLKDLVDQPHLSNKGKEATVDVHVAIDRCHQLEKAFLAKFSKDLQLHIPNLHHVCLAHIFVSAQETLFSSLEAFDILMHTQVLPVYEDIMEKLGAHSRETRDWMLLYRPMGNYLVKAYRHLLQMQVFNKSHSIINSSVKHIQASPNASQLLPYVMASHAAQGLRASQVGLTLTKVDSYLHQEVLEHQAGAHLQDLQAIHREIAEQFIE